MGQTQTIQENLNRSALIVRKYNLGDKEYFFSTFQDLDKPPLESSWTFATKKIQNREIIKDASVYFNSIDNDEINSILTNFGDDINSIYMYLNSSFDVKLLKLRDENLQRRIRHILADKYLNQIIVETKNLYTEHQSSYSTRFKKVLGRYKIGIGVFLTVAAFLTPRIIEGLTPPENLLNTYLHDKYSSIKNASINEDILTNYLHEDSKYKFNGAICNDGWTSHSQGRGTCSHHGGVDYYFYEGDYRKSLDNCRQKAIKVIDELRKKAFQKSWRD